LTVQVPKIENWPEFRQVKGQLPFRFKPREGSEFAGEAPFRADSMVNLEQRQVTLDTIRLDAGPLDPAVRQALQSALNGASLTVGLDAVLLALSEDFQLPEQLAVSHQLNYKPPRIVVSYRPMRLMLIDGPPALTTIEPTELEFVVNTDWSVFHDRRSDHWYILDDGYWITNTMLSSGDWLNTTELPRDFLTLQVSSEWPRVGEAMPPRKSESKPLPITISYEPTELVVIDGEAKIEPIGSQGLQYVSNTDNDLFLYDGRYWLLAAGRWFVTKDLKRQWSAVRKLPPVFAEIPEDHPRGPVLASVPGTRAARLALVESVIPRIANVESAAASQLNIPYLGEPHFVEIEGTSLKRAENTPFQVIMHNNFYYLCYDGAWYSSPNPEGPWSVARKVPEAIYTIPSTDPAYNVTFVRLESFDDSTGRAAYVSKSGYYNRYYTGSTMVYGTGWYYPGYYDRYAYWRYPHTYGYGGYRGPYGYGWGYPHYYNRSETYEINQVEQDWEWSLDGSKRRVYNYGPKNYVGGTYRMPTSDNFKGDGG
jgi:hypothetical protein